MLRIGEQLTFAWLVLLAVDRHADRDFVFASFQVVTVTLQLRLRMACLSTLVISFIVYVCNE